MPTRYILRIQPDVAEDSREVGERLARFAKDSRADEVCLFLCNMEFWDGHVTVEELERWLGAARGWRDALLEAGIDVSLNPANTLGHGDWDRTFHADQRWQPMVDQRGRAATAQVCPLDPTWRDYFVDVLSRCARDGYGTVWIEDDIRLHNHMPLDWGGCFCPLHLQEFAVRTGIETSREELVATCTAPGTPSPWRSEWMRMWDETGRELLALCRAAVAAEGSRLGLMSSRTEQHAAEGRDWPAWLEIPAAHRPHFWGYSEVTGREFASSVVLIDQQRGVQPAGLESYPEIECWPYGAWNKSYAQTAAQMALAHVAGSDGLALSVTDFLANHPDDEPGLSGFLAQWRGTMDWLSESFPKTMRSTGVGLPWSMSAGRDVALDRSTPRWQSLVVHNRGWAHALLGTGHATTATASAVNALSGESAWGFDDDELGRMLGGGLLLDAGAAVVLARRGFGHLIGLDGAEFVERPAAIVATREVCHDAPFTLRPGASFSVDPATWPEVPGGAPCRIMQGVPAEGARIISSLVDAAGRPAGHGAVLFENDRGGRVATVPWPADRPNLVLSRQLAAQLTAIVDWLGGRGVRASGAPWLVPYSLADGDREAVAVWNAGGDDAPAEFPLRMNVREEQTTVVHVRRDGSRAAGTWVGGVVRLSEPLRPWEFIVVVGGQ